METSVLHNPEQTVRQLAAGDQQAFNRLYATCYRKLVYFSFQLTKNSPQAEDIASIALIKLWEKRTQFKSAAAIQTFLYTTTRNAAIDYLRAYKVRENAIPSLRQQDILNNPDEDQLLAWELEAELLQHIYDSINTLPAKTREIFEMIYFQGMTTEAISQQLGIPAQTVRNNKTRALDHLRLELLRKNISPVWLLIFFFANSG